MGEEDKERLEHIPSSLPLLPVRDVVVFPYMIVPLFVGRSRSVEAVEAAMERDRLIFLVSQKDPNQEEPELDDLYQVGTISAIMRLIKLPDGRIKILVQGLLRARVKGVVKEEPFLEVEVEELKEKPPQESTELTALVRTIKEGVAKIASYGKPLPPDFLSIVETIEDPVRLVFLTASNLGFPVSKSQALLEESDVLEALRKLSKLIVQEVEILSMQAKIQSQAKEEMSKTQREYFLREQIKAIKQELGEGDEFYEEIEELREAIEKARLPKVVRKEAEKQLSRLESMHPDSAEAAVIRTYLDWILELPWKRSTRDNLDLKRAKRILDEDHYNLEKVKERILEFLGVRKLKRDMKGPILCFVGPPGVGKTSLGRSIAKALGRRFVRISLGGLRDEAEIRGHRRTYVGAMPGKIIQGIKQAGSNNPVFMLDEIDKVGTDFRGDPASALLEVLDPEQNSSFVDNYLNLPFDLSRVMFIATANITDTIPPALLDRMEVIEIPGYTIEEKMFIAKRHLVPKQIKENGLTEKDVSFSDDSIRLIIQSYTMEAGVRNLERQIASICRKVARKIAEGKKKSYRVTSKNVHKFLGPPKYIPERELEKDEIGVATGLAWTPYGGDIIFVEAVMSKGKGKLNITGQLGDVMKESVQAALSYLRAHAKDFGVDEDVFEKKDFHIHVPEGAVPKDGPSAGITMVVALVSLLTGIPVRKDVAMTGEITLRGKVLPVGGIKEKVLAAQRARIKEVILPKENDKDLIEIPKSVKKSLKIHLVETIGDALKIALKESPFERGEVPGEAERMAAL